jgi:hypothetical protein
MEEVNRHHPEQRAAAEPTYERNDVNVRGVLVFGLGLVLASAVILLLMWWLLNALTVREAGQDRPPSPVAVRPGESVPPEPRLQVSPSHDMGELRAGEEALLHSYGWVDRQAGVVRIPIERAMQVLLERGLPTRARGEGDGAAERNDDASTR